MIEESKIFVVDALYPGVFVANTSTQEFASQKEAFAALKKQEKLVGFSISSVDVIIHNGKRFTAEPEHQKEYLIALSKPLTKTEIQNTMPDKETLLRNMEWNDWKLVVQTHQGFLPIEKGTIVLDKNFNQIYPPQLTKSRSQGR